MSLPEFLVAINTISGIYHKNPETKGFFKNLDKKILGLSHAQPRPVKESESNPCPHRLRQGIHDTSLMLQKSGINSPVEGKVVEIPHDLQGFCTIPGAGVQEFLNHQQYVTILPAFYMLILNFQYSTP